MLILILAKLSKRVVEIFKSVFYKEETVSV